MIKNNLESIKEKDEIIKFINCVKKFMFKFADKLIKNVFINILFSSKK